MLARGTDFFGLSKDLVLSIGSFTGWVDDIKVVDRWCRGRWWAEVGEIVLWLMFLSTETYAKDDHDICIVVDYTLREDTVLRRADELVSEVSYVDVA